MPRKFYVDTSVWRDYFEDRKDKLRKDYSDEKIKLVFSSFKHFLEIVPISNKQYLESKRLAKVKIESHELDILHAVLARDNKAVLITRDFHFETL